jgi:hypothetical protein
LTELAGLVAGLHLMSTGWRLRGRRLAARQYIELAAVWLGAIGAAAAAITTL